MGEPETTTTPTTADRNFDPTPQSTPSEAPSGPSAAPQSTGVQTPASPAPWADSLAQRFPDEGVRSQVDVYLRDTIQPYVTQFEQTHGQASSILDTLLADDPDPEQQLNTYLALTEAAYGPEVALKVANHLVDALGLDPGAQGQQEQQGAPPADDTTVPPPELDQYLNSLPPQVRAVVEAQIASEEDAQWEQMLQTQVYPADWTTKAQDGALFSQYAANTETLQEAMQLWSAQMKPVIEKNPELFGLQAGGAAPQADPGQAASAAAQAAAVAAQAAPGAPNVLGTTAATGPTTPPQEPAHTSLDDAVALFLQDINGAPADAARGL
jgi:hypothetical protein